MKWFKVLAVLALAVLAVSVAPSVARADGPIADDPETSMPSGSTRVVLEQTPNNTLIGYGSKRAADKRKSLNGSALLMRQTSQRHYTIIVIARMLLKTLMMVELKPITQIVMYV